MSVSYIVPVYNKARYVRAVLGAAERERAATGGEIIVIDDGSTDGSLDLIRECAAGKAYFTVRTKVNGGVASSTNLGFSLAGCPLVRFIDGDDVIVPGSTALLREILTRWEAGFAYGRFGNYAPGEAFPPVTDRVGAGARSWRVSDPLMRVLTSQAFIPSVTLAVHDRIAGCFPLPESHRTSQDFIMSVRLARRVTFAETEALCCWVSTDVPGRLSGSKARMFADTALLLAEEWEAGRDGSWPAPYCRYAVRRMAGRAEHYARRHLRCPLGQRAWLLWQRLVATFPLGQPGAAVLRRIAATYAEAIVAPTRYP